jgi:hypothetical protein
VVGLVDCEEIGQAEPARQQRQDTNQQRYGPGYQLDAAEARPGCGFYSHCYINFIWRSYIGVVQGSVEWSLTPPDLPESTISFQNSYNPTLEAD